MKKKLNAGVVGWPVKHSISPILHRFWLEENNVNGDYVLFTVMPNDFESFMRNLPHENIKGLNITLPYKQEALKFCDRIDAAAKRAGAVNTIVIDHNRKLLGTNTDIYGFVQNLKSRFPRWSSNSAPVAVIGSGGAARAVIIGLQDHLNVKNIKLFNRSKDRARKLSTDSTSPINHRCYCPYIADLAPITLNAPCAIGVGSYGNSIRRAGLRGKSRFPCDPLSVPAWVTTLFRFRIF